MGSLEAGLEIWRVTLRQLLGRRRTILLVLLSLVPVLLAVAFRAAQVTDVSSYTSDVFDPLYVPTLLPIVAVLFGTGAFGAEIEDGTIVYLMAKPVSRFVIVIAKALSAVSVAALLTLSSVALVAVIELLPAGSQGGTVALAYAAAMIVGCLCYTCVFMALSLFTRRALVIGIGYMLVWEAGLSSLLPGISNLSIRQYALGVADGVTQLHSEASRLPPTTALTLSAILVVAALALATWRLMRFELPGSSD
jgi:ABC-2 type transport system permease protein